MNVGHGSALIPVRDGEELGGYLGRTNGLTGSLDPLEAHALSFETTGDRFVLVVLDVVCVNADAADAIRVELATVASEVWVSATHTHSGPETGCVPGGGTTPADVLERLVVTAVAAAERAVQDERAAVLEPYRAWARGVANRRNVADDPFAALPIDGFTVLAADGSRTGTFIVSPIHPTVFGADNLSSSADLTGGIRRAAEVHLGGWAVVATGAAGDVSTRATRRDRTLAEADRLGTEVVSAVAEALSDNSLFGVDAPSVASGAHGGVVTSSTTALLAPNPDESALPAAPDAADAFAVRRYSVLREGLDMITARRSPLSSPVSMGVWAASFGAFDLVALPGEPYLAVGEAIRSGATRTVIVLGYTNGYIGYLPDSSAPLSYETVVSPVHPASAAVLVSQAALTLDSLHRAIA